MSISQELLFVTNYTSSNDEVGSVDVPKLNVYTPTPQVIFSKSPPSPRQTNNSWLAWLWPHQNVQNEEEEYVEYTKYLEYYYQLGDSVDDWDVECYNEVLKDTEFIKFFEEKEEKKRQNTLKKFETWKQSKEDVSKSCTWKMFKSGNYQNSSAYKRYFRLKTKECFNEYVKKKKIGGVVMENKMDKINLVKKDRQLEEMREVSEREKAFGYLTKIGVDISEATFREMKRIVHEKIPRFDFYSRVMNLSKSVEAYKENIDELVLVITKYQEANVLKSEHIEQLKQLEVFAKSGVKEHVTQIEKYIKERNGVVKTITNQNGINGELLAFFKMRTVDSN
ncbi:hypothetical protein EIN_135190 [Entamoeba invadens IP1]|uniref:Uncharacterized protein n=1 Tax=Entamoeba invadens IP1 TaxID=370355 RepID=A0A0A1TX96_ENTIV|nr:hypothetical protein EIN_135190 [Entamoeba invadens IP1]ELP85935.1 hypothetical protein EIN_135190 [Entamoeba invadens IP1]|eukprot:XP_004185281.1 hypothetical protein EIN_135190 [Entamoeba invadens IP1]